MFPQCSACSTYGCSSYFRLRKLRALQHLRRLIPIMTVVMVACHCRNHSMVMTMVVLMASPKRAQNWSSELSRGPFCAVVCAEREHGATIAYPELVWGSFWTAFRAERG
eukprot:3433486-Alexandrium_andersonii.AAC.1